MKEIPAADKTLATIGAVLWSVQVIPQIIKSWRTKSTEGLSAMLMFIWACATTFQGAYLVSMRSSIPLQIQPQLFGFFGAMSWAQCLYYGQGFSLWKTLLCLGVFYAIAAGFEAGSVFALWAGEDNGVTWPEQMYGWITSALLAAGLLPQYWEIYRHKEVVGISLLFMAVDILGGLFSGISLFFRDKFDSTAFVQYMLVVVLDGLVVILAFILNPIAKRRRAREAALAEEENAVGMQPAADDVSVTAPAEEVEAPTEVPKRSLLDLFRGKPSLRLQTQPGHLHDHQPHSSRTTTAAPSLVDDYSRDKSERDPSDQVRDRGRTVTMSSNSTAVSEAEPKSS